MSLSATESIESTAESGQTFCLDCPITLYTETSDTETSDAETSDTEASEVQPESSAAREPFEAIARQLTINPPATYRLLLSVSLSQYQQVLDQGLFHLKPEIRGPLQSVDFQHDLPILLELGLDSTQAKASEADLRRLGQKLEQQLDAAQETTEAEKTETIAMLPNQTNQWRCRAVRQQQGEDLVGYTTLWAYAVPAQTEPLFESGAQALGAIASLFENTKDVLKTEVEQDLPRIKQHLSKVSDQLVAALEHVDWEAAIAELAEDDPLVSEIAKQFFEQDDWAYVQLPNARAESTVLQLAFQGDRGRWACLAHCNDPASQIVFYSLCPIQVPADRFTDMTKLLMRANDGLIIGNFELNFETGEIRYKTSLDVEGDRLSVALVKTLVYTNVQTLDTYLPGIISLLEKRCTPVEAIEQIEAEQPEAEQPELEPVESSTAKEA